MDPELETEDPDLEQEDPETEDPELDPEDPETEEPDPEEEPEPEPEPEPQRVSRAQARIRRQQEETRRLRDEVAAARQAATDAQRQMATLQQTQTQAQQAERLANMTPEERNAYLLDQRMQGLQQQIQRQSWELQEATDKTTWQSKAASDPVAKKYAARVEARLLEMRQNGQTAPRESVYFYLLGQDMATKGPKAVASARAAATKRVASATGEPIRSRGNAAAGRGRLDPDSIEALEERLKNQTF